MQTIFIILAGILVTTTKAATDELAEDIGTQHMTNVIGQMQILGSMCFDDSSEGSTLQISTYIFYERKNPS